MSLRLRLTLFYSAFFALILSFVAIAVYTLTERSLTQGLEQRGREALEEILEGDVESGLRRLPSDAYYEILIYPARPDGLTDQDLRNAIPLSYGFLSQSFGGIRPNPTDVSLRDVAPPAMLDSLGQEAHVAQAARLPDGSDLLLLGGLGRLSLSSGTTARFFDAVAFVGIPSGGVRAQLSQLASDLTLTVLLAFVIFAVGVWLLSRQVLSPVQRVTQAASRVSGRDLSLRVPVPTSRDEMRDLASTINSMLGRLQESFETQRRFTADASHELRTPVTAIVGHANYLLRRTRPSAEQIDSLTVIRREAERMAKLVNDLLELARADAGLTISREPMNLVEVVAAVHMELAPVAPGVEITVSAPEPLVEVSGDPSRLKQVALNLVQNAINAGAHRISLTVMRDRSEARLEVLDDGPGIPAEAIPHLFDRFYRVDNARSGRGNGSGLGLAIVRWIVQQHGGRVEVESRPGEGSVFTVTLPTSDARPGEANVRQTLHDAMTMLKRDA